MYLIAGSVFDGTWGGSQPIPDELADFLLMQKMGWSWRDLYEGPTPEYVRVFCLLFLELQGEAQQ